MKKYAYTHQSIDIDFQQSSQRFHVEELPLHRPSGKGGFIHLHIKKYDLSTWRLIHILKEATGAGDRDIGYAGLKDKNATTSQFITLPKSYESRLKNVQTDRIQIVDKSYNHLPIKIGQLKGNRFKIILKNMDKHKVSSFDKIAEQIERDGFPNYFGYQRFGEDGKSWQMGKEIAHSGKRLKGAKEKLLVSAYQSYLFNNWLSRRVDISSTISHGNAQQIASLAYPQELVDHLVKQRQFFKLFIGDSIQAYPFGKSNWCKDMQESSERFFKKEISPTGLLSGDKAQRAQSDARYLEERYDDEELTSLRGSQRFAWVWPKNYKSTFDEKRSELTVEFELPKGSYATSFLEEVSKKDLKPKGNTK